MMVERSTGRVSHLSFGDLPGLIPAGDLLVLNTTRVLRARLLGTRESGAAAEVLLLRRLGDDRWEAMVHPGARLKPGRMVHVAEGFDVEILETTPRHTRVVRLCVAREASDAINTAANAATNAATNTATDMAASSAAVDAAVERYGHVPLPPYITRADLPADAERYQTVYSREPGSVAAPTAGLHFTPELLEECARRGVARTDVLLHVGAGTFRPVESDDPSGHTMHEEWFRVPAETARSVNGAHARGAHVWAVGTTSLRALESVADDAGVLRAAEGETAIFIRPPMRVRSVDRLVTNFHLPRSTLLMLVAAFAGLDLMREAYATAVRERYRFYSYGDAMVIV